MTNVAIREMILKTAEEAVEKDWDIVRVQSGLEYCTGVQGSEDEMWYWSLIEFGRKMRGLPPLEV